MTDSTKWPEQVIVYTDGASRGNPGPASIGVLVTTPTGEIVLELGEKLGNQTNNFAEYTAVVRSLQLAAQHGARRVTLRSDSELMVKQVTGVYKVKSPVIIPLFTQVREAIRKLESVKFEHVRREFNTEADRLANMALDSHDD